MHPKTKQRGSLGAIAGFFSLLLLLASSPARSQSIQIFIESAFVHRKNANCVVETINGVPRFRCPPIPTSVCQAITTGSCPASCNDVNGATPGCGGAGSTSAGSSINPTTFGNISNEPHIEFDQQTHATICDGAGLSFPAGINSNNVCNSALFLCASVGYGNASAGAVDVPVDELSYEIFKFQNGSNPLDPASTPPLRTFFIDSPGVLTGGQTSASAGPLGPFCVLWDGSVNLQGEFGKTNGQYGFRVQVKTNQTGTASGNVQITAVRAYPSGATRNDDTAGVTCTPADANGCIVSQEPMVVDVTNVHVVNSSPTLVGSVTPVPVQPYNLTYRLSKDATMYINITESVPPFTRVRTLLPGNVRVGEGVPQGTLTNGDSWNGRADNGSHLSPGVYLAQFQGASNDQYGADLAEATTRQIGLDPLQITDVRVQPLLEGATSLAIIDYVLTEPATAFIDIYPPGTQFCNFAANVQNIPDQVAGSSVPPKNFAPSIGGCAGTTALVPIAPVKRIVEQKNSRTPVINFWDGRDTNGSFLGDGDYVFILYGSLQSQNGSVFNGNTADRRIWTSQAKSGFVPIIRGFVGISQVTPSGTVIGSNPAVGGLTPFLFRYSLSRDAYVNLSVYDVSGNRRIKTIVNNEIRQGNFAHTERWEDGAGDDGLIVSSGSYLVQLTATDPAFPAKISTTTALFSINLFRVTDVQAGSLISGTSEFATISYQLSQTMDVGINIYPSGTVIVNTTSTWPPCGSVNPGAACNQVLTPGGTPATPIMVIRGFRVGRLRITEQWDGRDPNSGLFIPDGQYVFTLAAQSTTTPTYFATDRVQGTLSVQRGQILFPSFTVSPDVPPVFNSSNTVTLHPFTINYSLTRQSSVTIQVLTTNIPPSVVRTVVSGGLRQGSILLSEVWDGRDDSGNFPPSGFYTIRAVASDLASQLASGSTVQVTIAYDPLRIYDVAITPLRSDTRTSSIFYQVSEPMKVAIKIYKNGTSFDPSGNPNPPESLSLVKRIIGVRPARTLVEDVWDGTDLRLSLVQDGTYKFKIVASTDTRAIDDVTGNVLNPSALSLDRIIDEIPVVRNSSLDPQGDFERNTFVYPNPLSGPTGTFSVFLPFQGHLTMRIYNVAGDLVLEKDFGEQAPSYASGPASFIWSKTNQAGRNVARGIYFAVFRVEETLGGKNILQAVKKMIVP